MQITLIHNPSAGDDTSLDANRLVELITNAGHHVLYRSTHDQDWPEALKAPTELVAVAGGDGTVAKVGKQLLGGAVPIAVLPMGTANNISRTLGTWGVPIETQIQRWHSGRRVALDAGVVTGPSSTLHFLEGIGVGLVSWLITHADDSDTLELQPDAEAKMAHAVQLLKRGIELCPAFTLEATLDGVDLAGEYILFEVMNTQFIGPNLRLVRRADLGDGLFDVVLVRATQRAMLRDYLEHAPADASAARELPIRRGRQLRIVCGGFDLHIDDQIEHAPRSALVSSALELTIKPRALEFLLPG